MKHLLILLTALFGSLSASASVSAPGCVHTPDAEGTSHYYSFTAYYLMGSSFYQYSGLAQEIVWGSDGKTLWFSNLMPTMLSGGNSWVEGTYTTDSEDVIHITVPVQHFIDTDFDNYYGDGIVRKVGICAFEKTNSAAKDLRFKIDNDYGTIQMEDPYDYWGIYRCNDDGQPVDDSGNVLAKPKYFNYCTSGTFYQADSYIGTIASVPATAEESNYVSQETSTYSETTYTELRDLRIDGQDYYFRGLLPHVPYSWIKGTKQGTELHIPSNQFLGSESSYLMDMIVTSSTEQTTNSEGEKEWPELDEAVFDLDDDGNYVLRDGQYLLCYQTTDGSAYDIFQNVVLKITELSADAIPAKPYNLELQEESSTAQWAFSFYLPDMDVDGNLLPTDELYYRFYKNGELQTFLPADHPQDNLPEEGLTDVPYSHSGFDLYSLGYFHAVYFDVMDTFLTLGVQTVYKHAGGETVSDIATLSLEGISPLQTSPQGGFPESATYWVNPFVKIQNGKKILERQ